MNQKIEIKSIDGKTIFKGNVLDIPIKDQVIIERSIDVFDDDDPCIIHRSYVVKQIIDELLTILKSYDKTELNGKEIKENLDFLKFSLETSVFYLGG